MFMSAEANNGRVDCGPAACRSREQANACAACASSTSATSSNPKLVANVQTCRGSHTHTVVEEPKDKENIYIYVSGSAGVRSTSELAGCVRDEPDKNPTRRSGASRSSRSRSRTRQRPRGEPREHLHRTSPACTHGLSAAKTRRQAARQTERARARGGFIAPNPSVGRR
jgi:hypothetical protein